MKNSAVTLLVAFAISIIIFAFRPGRNISAQTPINFGVSQDYGAIKLGSGQKSVVENTNNSNFQMAVETHFISNDGAEIIAPITATIAPRSTSEIEFAPKLLPSGCAPSGRQRCDIGAFRVRAVAIITTGQIKPSVENMCDAFVSAQTVVGADGAKFVVAPNWTHAWPGSGQPLSPTYSSCPGSH